MKLICRWPVAEPYRCITPYLKENTTRLHHKDILANDVKRSNVCSLGESENNHDICTLACGIHFYALVFQTISREDVVEVLDTLQMHLMDSD